MIDDNIREILLYSRLLDECTQLLFECYRCKPVNGIFELFDTKRSMSKQKKDRMTSESDSCYMLMYRNMFMHNV